MSDRYTRRLSDGEQVCTTCGSLVSNHLAHDLFHNRFNLMYDAIPASMSGESITATDWQAAHDAGEDEEMVAGERALASEAYDRAVRDAIAIVERVAGERVRPDGDMAVQILAVLYALLSDHESVCIVCGTDPHDEAAHATQTSPCTPARDAASDSGQGEGGES